MKRKILVVDNNNTILQYMSEVLGKRGYIVKTAENGLEALKIAETFVPDIFFIDLIMPYIDGEKLSRIIGSLPKFKNTFIIILSAIAAEDSEKLKYFDFAHAYIVKRPFKLMVKDIFSVLESIEEKRIHDKSARIYGLENLYSREITKELLLSRNHLNAIISNISDGIIELAFGDQIVNVNPVAVSFLGLPEKELLASNFCDLFSSETNPVFRCILEEIGESPIKLGDESPLELNERLYSISFIPVRGTGSESIIVIMRDISKQKQVETALYRAKEAAEEMSKIKSTFLANMSHELRTPLNAILGFTQLLEMDSESLSDKHCKFMEYIKSSGDHLLEMANDILDLSRIEAGKIEIEKRPFDLSLMLSRSPLTIKSLADKKRIQMELNIAPDLGVLDADEVRIKQVLYNLLSNALKFTEPGMRIGIEAHVKDNQAIIEVWDEGIGIAKEDREKIFDPFEQVGQAEAGKPIGTGLGLAISRRLIELHGGSLTVKSSKGVGSRFMIVLPGIIAGGNREAPKKDREIPTGLERSGSRGNILVIEDNEINIKLMTALLNRLGHTVHTEKLGREGVKAAITGRFDLVLMDIQLPDISGIEALKMIRKEGKHNIPIIALTASAMKGDKDRFKAEGFTGYLSKPIDIRNLQEALDNLLPAR